MKKFLEYLYTLLYLRIQMSKEKQKIDLLDLDFLHFIPNHYIGTDFAEYKKARKICVKQYNGYCRRYKDLFYRKDTKEC